MYIDYGKGGCSVKTLRNDMRKEIKPLEYATQILKGVSNGVLLTTKAEEKVNSMAISWGTFGIEWNKLIFTAFVRESRFTREQLDKNGEFTINIPVGEFNKGIIGFCGSKSGREVDKIKELNLTLVEGEKVSVPAIKELPLTLECKVIYKQMQDFRALPEEIQSKCYPQDVESSFSGSNRDGHLVFCGEVVNAYIIEE